MSASSLPLSWAAVGGVAIAAVAGYTGFRIGQSPTEPEPAPEVVEEVAVAPSKPEPDPFASNEPSDAEVDAFLEDMLAESAEEPPPFNPEDMQARQERWENMSLEQRRMMRKSMFAALAKVDGLEEVGDAIRQGKIDPRQFNLNPEAIADRMEFYADSMDQAAMEEEVTKTLQSVVDQARSQMGGN